MPRFKQWKAIVDELSQFEYGGTTVAQIANNTLNAVKKRMRKCHMMNQ